MIYKQTVLKVSDNSGAKTAKCIKILASNRKFGFAGELVLVSIKKLRNKSKKVLEIKKGQIYKAMIIRTKKNIKNKKGTITAFNQNCISLINKQNNPVATRILGPSSKKLKKNLKINSICTHFA